MRVISIGLDGKVGDPVHKSHAVEWVREMARHVEGYVEIGPSPDGHDAGPIRLADNAEAWLLGGSPLAYPFRAQRLAAELHRRQPFDVITTEDPIRAGMAGVLLARRTGLPLNVENHSFHVNEPIWLKEKAHHRVYNRIAIAVCRRADSIRNYSAGQAEALLKIGVRPERMCTVPIAAPVIAPVEPATARRMIGMGPEPFVLCAGRMTAIKNIPVLLSALAHVTPALQAKLLLIGDGAKKAEWMELSKAAGVSDRVLWREAVPFDAMAAYYSAAAALAVPSFKETGPRTVLEALLCGCPVLLTPETGVVRSGVCVDNDSAMVIASDDVAGWTRALESVLTDRELGSRLARAGRARIGPEFSFQAIAVQVADLLKDTVRNGSIAHLGMGAKP